MDKIKVDWNKYKDCPGTSPDSNDHTCPMVVYRNIDGDCSHHACEGKQEDCGRIISIKTA